MPLGINALLSSIQDNLLQGRQNVLQPIMKAEMVQKHVIGFENEIGFLDFAVE